MSTMRQYRRTLDILLVEDDPSDIRFIEECIAETPGPKLRVVRNGEEAIRLLRQEPPYGPGSRPNLVLMDLNLPRKDGRELLSEIRSTPALTHLPVVVLTTSSSERDVEELYRLHASGFVTKPSDLNEFLAVIRGIVGYWSMVCLPPSRDG